MSFLLDAVENVNVFLWDFALLFLLLGTGVYYSFKLRFVQVRRFKEGFQKVFGGFFQKKGKGFAGQMTSFQSLATAVAAQVGTGNLAGAATAIVSGGPGAIFWMWASSFFSMATIFSEATLAQRFKVKKDGEVSGGPIYYIQAAFSGRFGKILSGVFAVFVVFALGFMGNMVQANSIGQAFSAAFSISPAVVGVLVALVCGFVFLGGMKRIASFSEKVVPPMAVLYILGALVVIGVNYASVWPALKSIFVGAFSPGAVLGGAAGVTMKQAVRFGVARGLFSNEAGMGSTPHAHAAAKVDHPCEQGLVAMVGVFIDTFVILTLTALVILTSGVIIPFGNPGAEQTGTVLTQSAFSGVFGQGFGPVFVAVCLLFFAITTIISWYFFGEINVRHLFGRAGVKVYAVLVLAFIVLGSCLKVDLVWALADMANAFMALPNLLALLALSPLVARLLKNYEKK